MGKEIAQTESELRLADEHFEDSARGQEPARGLSFEQFARRSTTLRVPGGARPISLPNTPVARQVLGDAAALHRAAREGRADLIQQLLRCGVDPNLGDDPDGAHRTPIRFMSLHEDVGQAGVDGVKLGRAACHMAAARGHADVVRELIKHGCDVNLCDHAGKTPLMLATQSGFLEAARHLIRGSAALDARDLRGSSALMAAAAAGQAAAVRLLIDTKAEVDACDAAGRTPLLAAAAGAHVEAVCELLRAGANVSARDGRGLDALDSAICSVDTTHGSDGEVVPEARILPLVSMLLSAGAQCSPNAARMRLSELATERGYAQVATLLRGHGK